jgi:Tfp pilus assembly protein PilO
MAAANRLIVAILAVAALAIGFWTLALSPKREKADELSSQADSLKVSLVEAQSQVAQATVARQDFPADYQQLVSLGKAVPAGDETSSLLVELNQVATDSKVKFESIQLTGSTEAAAPVEAPVAPAPEAPTAGASGAVPAAEASSSEESSETSETVAAQ